MLSDEQFLKLSQISYIDFPNIFGKDIDGNEYIKSNYSYKTMEQIYQYLTQNKTTVTRKDSGITETCDYIDALTPIEKDKDGIYKSNPENGTVYQREMKEIISAIAGYTTDIPPKLLDPESEMYKKYSAFKDMKLIDYENDNITDNNPKGTGFVAYAFEDNIGNRYLVYRGSEGGPPFGKDWTDNGLALFGKSDQFAQTKAFAEKNKTFEPGKSNFVTGHSKGGANAIYAAATVNGLTGKVFDGTGIGQCLTMDEATRLKNSGLVNFVGQNEPVGSLLWVSANKDLRVWQDTNGDGIGDAGELHTLMEKGVASSAGTGKGISARKWSLYKFTLSIARL